MSKNYSSENNTKNKMNNRAKDSSHQNASRNSSQAAESGSKNCRDASENNMDDPLLTAGKKTDTKKRVYACGMRPLFHRKQSIELRGTA